MNEKSIKVLIIEDNAEDAVTIVNDLVKSRYAVFNSKAVRTMSEGYEELQSEVYDAVVLDLDTQGSSGIGEIGKIKKISLNLFWWLLLKKATKKEP